MAEEVSKTPGARAQAMLARPTRAMSIEASATGNLQATPLGHLLVYLLDRGLTGSLVLEEASGDKHAIWFETGAPAKVKTATPVTYLGQVLVERRAITREVYERTLQGALHERRLHGEVLLETGAIDSRLLREALREQLARQVLWLFKLPSTTLYGYYDQVNLLERWGAPEGLRTRPLALIWRGLRRHASPAEIEAVTGRLGQRPIELHVDAPIRRFKFEASEQALIDVLRAKPQPLSSLIASGLAAPDDVKRLVYVLVILRQLDLGVPGADPVGADEAPSSSRIPIAPVGRTQPSAGVRPPTAGRASVPDVENVVPRPSDHHRVSTPVPVSAPGVPSFTVSTAPAARIASPVPASPGGSTPGDAPGSTLPVSPSGSMLPPTPRNTSPAPASPRSPSLSAPGSTPTAQVLGTGMAELRQELEGLLARLGGTHYQALGVAPDAPTQAIQNAFFGLAKRWHPDRLKSELSDLKDQATRVFTRLNEASQVLSDPERRRAYDQSLVTGDTPDEAEQVQKVLKATNAFQKAEVLLKRGNLAAAEKEALLAFQNDPTQANHVALHVWIQAQKPGAKMPDLMVQLDKAAKTEPNNLRVRWYRGQLLKRLGREREAVHDFRFIVERDARHTDAQREVRLYAMRHGGRPSSAPPAPPGSSGAPESAGHRASKTSEPKGLLGKFFKKPNN
ncbi:MAG TPA: DnaJ domain-containing protein [Polyangiaceae bacterium]|nr:DnaJ domain-containing protein [Polyangiaceae bacterium]